MCYSGCVTLAGDNIIIVTSFPGVIPFDRLRDYPGLVYVIPSGCIMFFKKLNLCNLRNLWFHDIFCYFCGFVL